MKSWKRWIPAVIGMAAIFYFSSRTGDDLNGLLPFFHLILPSMAGFDWGHFVAYYLLAWCFLWAVTSGKPGWKSMLLVILLCFLYGITDEFHQRYVPGRSPDLSDLRNDTIGAALAMATVCLPPVRRFYMKLSATKKYNP